MMRDLQHCRAEGVGRLCLEEHSLHVPWLARQVVTVLAFSVAHEEETVPAIGQAEHD